MLFYSIRTRNSITILKMVTKWNVFFVVIFDHRFGEHGFDVFERAIVSTSLHLQHSTHDLVDIFDVKAFNFKVSFKGRSVRQKDGIHRRGRFVV